VAGQTWITGFYQMGMHPTDPYPQGLTLTDTWMEIPQSIFETKNP